MVDCTCQSRSELKQSKKIKEIMRQLTHQHHQELAQQQIKKQKTEQQPAEQQKSEGKLEEDSGDAQDVQLVRLHGM